MVPGVILGHGDCLELLNLVEDGSVGMVLCDLPYGTTRNRWDVIIPFDALWEHWRRVCKPNAAIVLFGQGMFSARLMVSAPDLYKYSLVWKKGNRVSGFLNAKRQPLRNHEDILVFYREQPTYNPQMREAGKPVHSRGALNRSYQSSNYGAYRDAAMDPRATKRYPTSVLDFERPHPPIHPTQKSEALCEHLICTFTNPGEVVLDNTMGSGTTPLAAISAGRRCIAFEKDDDTFNLAAHRITDRAASLSKEVKLWSQK